MEGKIYRLLCNDGHYYIGSTTKSLRERKAGHEARSKNYTSKVYDYINTVGWDTVQIVLVEDFPCETMEALRQKEDEFIAPALDDPMCLNTLRAFLTPEQGREADNARCRAYYEANKEAEKAKAKAYKEANKEVIKARGRARRAAKKELDKQ